MQGEEYDQTFFGGKGSSKGKNRSSAKGKGRRTNPRGSDGQPLKCDVPMPNGSPCGSETHLRAEHHRIVGGQNVSWGGFASTSVQPTFTDVQASSEPSGPLDDILAGMLQEPIYHFSVLPTRVIGTADSQEDRRGENVADVSGQVPTAPFGQPVNITTAPVRSLVGMWESPPPIPPPMTFSPQIPWAQGMTVNPPTANAFTSTDGTTNYEELGRMLQSRRDLLPRVWSLLPY